MLYERKFLQEIRQNPVSQTLDSSRLAPSQAFGYSTFGDRTWQQQPSTTDP
jgi:hypothetical protein